MVYGNTNKALEYIIFEEGVIRELSGVYSWEYNLKDHLGNTRAVFSAGNNDLPTNTPKLVQISDYYPLGQTFAPMQVNNTANKYLYNGKELQDDKLDGSSLNMLDYGFRFYDTQIGRFTSIDPYTEKNHNQSGFVYATNTPIKYIDFMGLDTLLVDNKGRFSDKKLPDPNNKNDVIVKVSEKERKEGAIKYNKDGELRKRHKSMEVEKNSVNVRSNKGMDGVIQSSVISPKDIDTGLNVFKWLADNTNVEYSYIRGEGMPSPTITTNHKWDQESLGATEALRMANQGQYVTHIYNHPEGVVASDEDKAFYYKIGKYGSLLEIYSNDQFKSYQTK